VDLTTIPGWVFVLVLVVAAGAVYLLTPVSIRIGQKRGIVALPGGRRRHTGRVVRIGGLALFPAFALAALLPVFLGLDRQDPLELVRLEGVLLGMGIIWLMGILDDVLDLPAWAQLVGMVLASLVSMAFRVFVEVFNNPFGNQQVWVDWYLMVPVTLVWLLGMTGTMNMLDGLDGLATGVTTIAALVLFVHMLRLQQFSVALLPLALMGCCIGLLPYNRPKARIFLGGGAYLLGYSLGALSIVAGAKVATALLVLWLPIVDVVWQVYCRARRGQALMVGDRGHLHLRLQDIGWPTRRILAMYYGITGLLGAVGLLLPSGVLKVGALGLSGVVIIVVLVMAGSGRGGGVVGQ